MTPLRRFRRHFVCPASRDAARASRVRFHSASVSAPSDARGFSFKRQRFERGRGGRPKSFGIKSEGFDTEVASAETAIQQNNAPGVLLDRKSTRLNSSHRCISYAVFCW